MLRATLLLALVCSVVGAEPPSDYEGYNYDNKMTPEAREAKLAAAVKLDAEVAAKLPLPCLKFAREQKLGMHDDEFLHKHELETFLKDPSIADAQPRPDCLSNMIQHFGTLDKDSDGKVKMDEIMVTLLQSARHTVKEELR